MTQQEIVNRIVKLEGEIEGLKMHSHGTVTHKIINQKKNEIDILKAQLAEIIASQNPSSGNEGM